MVETTPADRRRFARNGFVVLQDALPEPVVEAAAEAVAETVPEDLTNPEALAEGPERRNYWGDLDDSTPLGPLNDRVRALAAAFAGGTLSDPGEFAQVAVRYPAGAVPADRDRPTTSVDGNPHVDVFGDDEYRPFALAATAYLDDVVPRGGGLTVWPGTHRRVAAEIRDRGVDGFPDGGVAAAVEGCDPFEVAAPAGTVVLWHPLLVHTGGQNLSRRTRVASFTRFSWRDSPGDEAAAIAETAADPFGRWEEVEQRGCGLGAPRSKGE